MARPSGRTVSGQARWGETFQPIPRLLHQTWKTPDVPERWRAFQQSWVRRHPHWRYVFWTDDAIRQLIVERYGWFLQTFDAFPRHIQRVDAAKYFILHAQGGVYADLDCECLRPVDELAACGGAIVGRTRDRVIECAILGSCPGHPLWETAFADMQTPPATVRALRHLLTANTDAVNVLFTTGPQMMRRAVRTHVRRCRRGETRHGITIYPPPVFSNRSWWNRDVVVHDSRSFVRHHYSSSWLSSREANLNRFLTQRQARRLAAGALMVSLVLFALWAAS